MNDLTPYEHRSRPIPSSMIEDVNKTIQKMLDDNVNEPPDSSFTNQLCIVRKPSGEVRITVDARKLNARSRMNYFRNENVESLLNKVNGAKFRTILDLGSAFWQIGLHEPCKILLRSCIMENSIGSHERHLDSIVRTQRCCAHFMVYLKMRWIHLPLVLLMLFVCLIIFTLII